VMDVLCYLEAALRLDGGGADPDDVEDPPETCTAQREQLDNATTPEAEIELVRPEDTKEDGEHEGAELGLALRAALWIRPANVALTEAPLMKRAFPGRGILKPISTVTVSTARMHWQHLRICARVEILVREVSQASKAVRVQVVQF